MAQLLDHLKRAVDDGASDLFIVAGGPVSEKLDKRMIAISEEKVFPKETAQLMAELYAQAGRSMESFLNRGDDDFSFSLPGLARFRVNAYKQRGSLAAVVRIVAFDIPSYLELGIPNQVMDLADVQHGMILVTGTAGSGKSTTQACIIDRINHTRQAHIITLEDPIEYLHRNQRSIVSQREIAIDTADYLSALRSCLRQAPDVILLGEMRDHETIRTAMTAAETGHLLIATLHTKGAVNTVDRGFLPRRPAGSGPGPAEHGPAYRGLPTASPRGGRRSGPRFRGDAHEQRHPQSHPRQQDPPNRLRHHRRRCRGNDEHGPVHSGALPRRAHHGGHRCPVRRQPRPAPPPDGIKRKDFRGGSVNAPAKTGRFPWGTACFSLFLPN